MPTNEQLIATQTKVEAHEGAITGLAARLGSLEQRVAALEALVGTLQTQSQQTQATLASDRTEILKELIAKARATGGTVQP